MEREQFTFYRSFAKAAARIKDPITQLQTLWAIIWYALDGVVPELDQLPEAAAITMEMVMPNLIASRKRAASGKSGGAAKKKTSKNEVASDDVTSKIKNKNKIKDKDKIKDKTKIKNNTDDVSEALGVCSDNFFDIFWELYPVKIDRPEAVRAWQRLQPDQTCREQILDSLSHWKKCSRWQNEEGRYIPNAAAFLDKGYWQEMPSQGKPDIPKGASGLGEAEKENIRRVLGQ